MARRMELNASDSEYLTWACPEPRVWTDAGSETLAIEEMVT